MRSRIFAVSVATGALIIATGCATANADSGSGGSSLSTEVGKGTKYTPLRALKGR